MSKTKNYIDREDTILLYKERTLQNCSVDELASRFRVSKAYVYAVDIIFRRIAREDESDAALMQYSKNGRIVRAAGFYFRKEPFIGKISKKIEEIKKQNKNNISNKNIDTTYEKPDVKNSYKEDPPTDGFHQESLVAGELIKNIVEMNIRMSEKINTSDKLEKEISSIKQTLDELIRMWK